MERLDLPQPESASSPLQCCCGSPDCAHLKQNCTILEAVEKDVHTAAQLGKVCMCVWCVWPACLQVSRFALFSSCPVHSFHPISLFAPIVARQILDPLSLCAQSAFRPVNTAGKARETPPAVYASSCAFPNMIFNTNSHVMLLQADGISTDICSAGATRQARSLHGRRRTG